jgi:hypothetical protein
MDGAKEGRKARRSEREETRTLLRRSDTARPSIIQV